MVKKHAVLLAVVCFLTMLQTADVYAEQITITAAYYSDIDNHAYMDALAVFQDTLEEVSGGEMTVEFFDNSDVEDDSFLVEKLLQDKVNLTVASPLFLMYIGIPEVRLFSMEFLFDDYAHWESCVDGALGDALRQVIAEKSGNNFCVMDYWLDSVNVFYGNKPIISPADMEGILFRTQAFAGQEEFFEACGAEPVKIAWDDLSEKLKEGEAEASDSDYRHILNAGHHKMKNGSVISETENEFTTKLLIMNGEFYSTLTDEQKSWIDEASKAATNRQRTDTISALAAAKAQIIADGAQIIPAEEIDKAAFSSIAVMVQDTIAEEEGFSDYLQMVREG